MTTATQRFPNFSAEKKSRIQLVELGKWNEVAQKQKSWKIVEKQGKFSVTLTGLEGRGRGKVIGK